jgi:hypothetical protein
VPQQLITPQRLRDHVSRLGEEYPPIHLDSVDRTIHDPTAVRDGYGHIIEYLARVELEVERNVLELLTLLPDVDETNRMFYQDVWAPQELQHGKVLDRFGVDLGMEPVEPDLTTVSTSIKMLGALSRFSSIQDVARLLYYLTGAATERSAVLAYTKFNDGMLRLGETAIAKTIVSPIKRQEPGHFAFYQLSATSMVQHGVLKPWQLQLARLLRSKSFGLVGANNREQRADYGGVVVGVGLDADLETYARDIGRVETRLLWAHRQGMEVPGYVLQALRDSVDAYRERESRLSDPAGA